MDQNPIDELNEPRLVAAGDAVARLPRPLPPPNLVARTLARVSAQYKPVKRAFFLLRPITHPLARLAAAATIIFFLSPATDLDWAEPIGNRLAQWMGPQAVKKAENWVDALLLVKGPAAYMPYEVETFMGILQPVEVPLWKLRAYRAGERNQGHRA